MINEYIVKSPNAFLHTSPSVSSEASDELLFGTRLFALSRETQKDDWLCVETAYGYRGFINKKYLYRKIGAKATESFLVTSPFCDILPVPEYKYKPVLTLPKGSVVEKSSSFGTVCGFTDIDIMGKRFFAASKNLSPAAASEIQCSKEALRKNIVDTALSYIDAPYRWGGKSPCGIDCSGLCFQSFFLNGITLWRDAVPDSKYVKQIRKEELIQADLIYFSGHMVMYIGGGEYIHASQAQGKVCINSFDTQSPLYYPKLDGGIIMCARALALCD